MEETMTSLFKYFLNFFRESTIVIPNVMRKNTPTSKGAKNIPRKVLTRYFFGFCGFG
jgi:hypothetical protein